MQEVNKHFLGFICLCKEAGISLFGRNYNNFTKPLRYLFADLSLHDILKFPISGNYVRWKNCPNTGDEWQCWWVWPSLALPLRPEMDAPKTDMKARNIEEWKLWLQRVPAMVSVVHIYFNGTHPAAMRVEIKPSTVGGLDRTGRRGRVFRHMDERRLESNQRVTKTGKQSVPINVSRMTSL